MIVRILGEGQFDVPETAIQELNRLDDALMAAVAAAEDVPFRAALLALTEQVRSLGSVLSDETLLPSEAILPPADIDLGEMQALLGAEGLIPG
jgi:hypothetical protein